MAELIITLGFGPCLEGGRTMSYKLPIILIIFGIGFLLHNLGIIGFTPWILLWPGVLDLVWAPAADPDQQRTQRLSRFLGNRPLVGCGYGGRLSAPTQNWNHGSFHTVEADLAPVPGDPGHHAPFPRQEREGGFQGAFPARGKDADAGVQKSVHGRVCPGPRQLGFG